MLHMQKCSQAKVPLHWHQRLYLYSCCVSAFHQWKDGWSDMKAVLRKEIISLSCINSAQIKGCREYRRSHRSITLSYDFSFLEYELNCPMLGSRLECINLLTSFHPLSYSWLNYSKRSHSQLFVWVQTAVVCEHKCHGIFPGFSGSLQILNG